MRRLLATAALLLLPSTGLLAQTPVAFTTGASFFSGCTTAQSFTFSDGISRLACLFNDGVSGQSGTAKRDIAVAWRANDEAVEVDGEPSIVKFGEFITQVASTSSSTVSSANFSLVVEQSAPTPGTRTITGAVAGSIRFQNSQLYFTPSLLAFDLAPVSYTITTNDGAAPGRRAISAPSTAPSLRATSLEGTAFAASTVPEPSTYGLLATGLGALGMVARRRRATR